MFCPVNVPTLFPPTRTIFSCPKVLVAQLCLTLWNPMDCSSPGSSVHGIFQARILEWVAISLSMGSSWPRDWTWVSCIAGRLYHLSHHGSPLMYKIPLNSSPGCTAAYFSRLGLGSSKQFSISHPGYTLPLLQTYCYCYIVTVCLHKQMSFWWERDAVLFLFVSLVLAQDPHKADT